MQSKKGKLEEPAVDEGLYSRQLYVLGREAQKRLSSASVVIFGLNGLGAEIAKNVILAGPASVVLVDDAPVELRDLGSQFYLHEADVGKPRASSCVARFAELNPYVKVTHQAQSSIRDLVSSGHPSVLVMNTGSLQEKVALNHACREHSVPFVCCDAALGLVSWAFCDFGKSFTVADTDGEEPVARILSSFISKGSQAPVSISVHEDTRHGLEVGNHVVFSELGPQKLATTTPVRVTKVTGSFTFETEPIPELSASLECASGSLRQVKVPVDMHFAPLGEVLAQPASFLVSTDFAKESRGAVVVSALQKLPQCATEQDLLKQVAHEPHDAPVLQSLFRFRGCLLAPMSAFLGGVVAQEALKACTGKFSPLKQLMTFDALECLPPNAFQPPPPPAAAAAESLP